ncbi:protein kinase-like protein [Xylariomycetidae sp. FL0641]|nr:protein kinase-like protein [Xylariomycetidae sp. FL0641]
MAPPASSDEGEIVEDVVGDSKATTLPQINGPGVDRMDRTRARYSRSRSPGYTNGSRHHAGAARRSRSPRGQKRSRNGSDSYRGANLESDPRRFRVHYENSRNGYSRSRLPYDDEDRPPSRSSTAAYQPENPDRSYARSRARDRSRDRERDHYPDKRMRKRSPSPYRPSRDARDQGDRLKRDDDRFRRATERDGAGGQSPRRTHDRKTAHRQGPPGEIAGTSKGSTKSSQELSNGNPPVNTSTLEPEPSYEEENPVDVEAELERRRRRREELFAKVRALQASAKPNNVSSPARTRETTLTATEGNTPQSIVSSPQSPAPGLQEGMSPAAFEISNDQELINTHGKSRNADDDGPSAADYDPTVDMREDEMRDERRHGHLGPHLEAMSLDQKAEIAPTAEPQPSEQSKADADDDDIDMFAEEWDEEKFAAPKAPQLDSATDDRKIPTSLAQSKAGGILEGDDKDGYYKIRIGEIMNGRYQVQSTLGKGMFSGVARALDINTKQLVAIKMMRNNDALRKGGFTEIAILQKLNESDPENRKHIVKFERHFEHKGHLCLAFENLSLNLREVLRKFGNNIGINLNATRAYAHQIFVALAHLRRCSIIHADLKPDNILVNESRNVLKICDLGTAIDRSDAATAHTEITPYLVSRFYRAPEIILGMPYDYAVDVWSIGCTLYELYTGKILFTGDSNNQMLKAMMEVRGKFSPKLCKRGKLSHMHFDELGNFVSVEQDKTLGKTTIRTLNFAKPTRDLRTRLLAASGGMSSPSHFVDLLERCLALNPDKRITPSEALKHPFFTTNLR